MYSLAISYTANLKCNKENNISSSKCNFWTVAVGSHLSEHVVTRGYISSYDENYMPASCSTKCQAALGKAVSGVQWVHLLVGLKVNLWHGIFIASVGMDSITCIQYLTVLWQLVLPLLWCMPCPWRLCPISSYQSSQK